jgi:outer membrane protein assembly factor BamB
MPGQVIAGDPGFVLTVSGLRFEDGAVVTWNGADRPTTWRSSTTLEAAVLASDVASPASAAVAVRNPDRAVSNVLLFTVAAAVPSISSLSPAAATVGDPSFVLTVTGQRFRSGAVVTWSYADRPTTFVSSTTLLAAIPANDLGRADWVPVGVRNPTGETSFFETFTVGNPVPAISSLSPGAVTVGSGDTTVSVNGGPFVSLSRVLWNGSWRYSWFVSPSELRVTLPASDLATFGTGWITVSSPAPGGGVSAAVALPIARPVPSPSAMSPASAPPGAPRFTLTVTGSGFAPDAVVRWNGTARPTSVVSSAVLHASIDAADVASSGAAEVSVFNPPPDGGAAVAGTFTIAPGSARGPQAVAYQLDPAHSGSIDLGAAIAFPADPAWVVTLSDDASYPLIAGGKVFVLTSRTEAGGNGTQLHALDLATGASVWGPVSIPGGFNWAGHAYDRGAVFVVDSSGELRAFDAATGALRWLVDLPYQYSFSSSPTATDGTVYVAGAGSGGTIYAVAESDGALRWTSWVGAATAAVAPDGVFVAELCLAYKLDLLTGSRIWSHGGPCSYFWPSDVAAYSPGGLYVRGAGRAASDPLVTVFDPFDGTSLATFGPATAGSWAPSLALGSSGAFLVAMGALDAVDLSGNPLWRFAAGGTLLSAPIAVNGVVFVGASTGTVYALDAVTGAELWSGDAGAEILLPQEGTPFRPLPGLAAGEGYLVVPAGRRITAWQIASPAAVGP